MDGATQKELAIGRRVQAERAVVERQLTSSRAVSERLHTQMANYHVPPTIEYIRTNDRVYKLKRKVVIWQRKLDIAKMTLLNLRAVHGIKSEPTTGQSAAFSGCADQSDPGAGDGDQSQAGTQGCGDAGQSAGGDLLRVVSSRMVPAPAGTKQ